MSYRHYGHRGYWVVPTDVVAVVIVVGWLVCKSVVSCVGRLVVTVGNVYADKLGSMWLTGTDIVGLNSTDGCCGAAWFGVLMIRIDVVELDMGTVRESTDTAGIPVGELVGGATCRAIGTGRVLGSVCGTLAVSIRPPVSPVVVMTAAAIAWFSTVCGGGIMV